MCVCSQIVSACRSCQAVIMQFFNYQPTPLAFPSCCFPLFILSLQSSPLFGLYLYPFISYPDIFGSVLLSVQSAPLFATSVKPFPRPLVPSPLHPICPFSHLNSISIFFFIHPQQINSLSPLYCN